MERKIQAVYMDGVLRLAEPLQLEEMQQVTVTVTERAPLTTTSRVAPTSFLM
jgi:predicted DNA-binding antitoxin AbrB/MazE fold protein